MDGSLKVWQPALTPAEGHLSDPLNGTGVALAPQRSFSGHHLGVVSVSGGALVVGVGSVLWAWSVATRTDRGTRSRYCGHPCIPTGRLPVSAR